MISAQLRALLIFKAVLLIVSVCLDFVVPISFFVFFSGISSTHFLIHVPIAGNLAVGVGLP